MELSDKDKVSIVAGVCLFGLVFVLKNVFPVPGEFINNFNYISRHRSICNGVIQ